MRETVHEEDRGQGSSDARISVEVIGPSLQVIQNYLSLA
jgi:hypothetical protein